MLDNTTAKEIELLRSFLKDEEIPAKDEERDPLVEFLFGNSSDQLRTEVHRFNLESRSGMIEEIYNHFFVREGKAANLYGDKLKGFENKFNAAQDEGAKIEALKEGFSRLLESNPLEKSRIVAILEDLALLRAAVW